MIIGIEWGRKSVAYERLWDIADVLRVDVVNLLRPSQAFPDVPEDEQEDTQARR